VAHAATSQPRGFRCEVCHEVCLSKTELDVHVVTVHSCPICHDGIYIDVILLEEHLEQHRFPYACHSCGLAYAEEDQLLEHYKDSPSDIHPHCEKCHLGFENNDKYTVVGVSFVPCYSEITNRDSQHAEETHPRIACDVCEGEFFDREELAIHYLSSRKHPKCEKCGVGFRDRFDYTDVSDKACFWFPLDPGSCSMVLLHILSVTVTCANGTLTPQISYRIIPSIFSIILNAKIATSGLSTRMRTNT